MGHRRHSGSHHKPSHYRCHGVQGCLLQNVRLDYGLFLGVEDYELRGCYHSQWSVLIDEMEFPVHPRCEVPVFEKDIQNWKSEINPTEMAFVVSAAKRQRIRSQAFYTNRRRKTTVPPSQDG